MSHLVTFTAKVNNGVYAFSLSVTHSVLFDAAKFNNRFTARVARDGFVVECGTHWKRETVTQWKVNGLLRAGHEHT